MELRISRSILAAIASALSLLLLGLVVTIQKFVNHEPQASLDQMEIHTPFVFSQALDPRSISTVGDQMISEHVFGFHARESITDGFGSVFSEVEFDRENQELILVPKFQVRGSDGAIWSVDKICNSIRASLAGTAHAPVGSLVRGVVCSADGKIRVQFEKLPVNIRYLFTLADFSIFDASLLPVTAENLPNTSGPYRIIEYSKNRVLLSPNPHYPDALRANQIARVSINSYPASQSQELLQRAVQRIDEERFLAYLYGYTLSEKDILGAREAGFRIRQMPSEWMLYWGFGRKLKVSDRALFFRAAYQWRKEMMEHVSLGQPAYSLSPFDRPFGLTQGEFDSVVNEELSRSIQGVSSTSDLSRIHTVATLEEWSKIPVVELGLKLAQERFKNLRVELISRQDAARLWSGEIDFLISPLGIAPADPLNNFAFQDSFRSIVPLERISKLSIEGNSTLFNSELKSIERDVLKAQLWMPIAHFPGVVVEHPSFQRVESLAWSWGIQAWTYRIDSQ